MSKYIVALAALVSPSLAVAASAGGAHAEGIPSAVIFQAVNFVLYAALLYFVLRKPVVSYFRNREQDFKAALIKAEAARKEAEQRRQEIQDRLYKLESTTDQSIAQARADAEALKVKILQEAEQLSTNLREEARRTAALEVEKAKHQLREELLNQSVALSKKMLEEKMAEPDQKRLQTEFVDKIQVVR